MLAVSDAAMTVIVFGGMGLLLFLAWVFESGVRSYQSRNDWKAADRYLPPPGEEG